MPRSKRLLGFVIAAGLGATVALLISSHSPTQVGSIEASNHPLARPSPHTSSNERGPELPPTVSAADGAIERQRVDIDVDAAAATFNTPAEATSANASTTDPDRRDPAHAHAELRNAPLGHESSDADEPARPTNWCSFKTHDDHDYLSDTSTVWNGSRSVWIGTVESPARAPYFSVDALWQGIDATPYRGTRIELSAHVKGRGYFQFFLRAARAADRTIVLTHNQSPSVPTTNRYVSLFPPNGADWTRLSIVGEIPADADVIYYGVALMNRNAIWIDDVRLSPAEPQMPLTNVQSHGGHVELPVNVSAMLSSPSNLDFEQATSTASAKDSACRISLGRVE